MFSRTRSCIPTYRNKQYGYNHGIGRFLGGLFRKILLYLNKSALVDREEALRMGINVIEVIEESHKLLKESVKSRFAESRSNLKRKAKEKINSLMRSRYKITSAKSAALQFPLGDRDRHTVHKCLSNENYQEVS